MQAVKISENNLLESAFQLAYFILGDKESAELSAIAAAARLDVAAVAQDRRFYYVPGAGAKAYGVRTKVSLSDLHLLQRLVYDETEAHERIREARGQLDEERLLIHFLKHLVRITLKRNSFYVALGVSRLLHRYAINEAIELYGVVIQNPVRVKDNHYWRSRKAQLMQEMTARFGDLIALTRGAYGEERFAARDDSPRYAPFIKNCLQTLMPWATTCPLPSGDAAVGGSIPQLDFKGLDPDAEHQVEIARIHALLHSTCFARLVAGLNLESPDARLEVPRFFLSRNHDESMPNHGLGTAEMSQPDLNTMRARLNEQEQLRLRANPRHLRLMVDGQERGTMDLLADGQTRFTLAEGEEFIELRTQPEDGDIHLALYPIDYARLEQVKGDEVFTLALADGRKLKFVITPRRDEYGELTGASVSVSAAISGWQHWRARFGAFFTPSLPAFSYTLTAALIAIGLAAGVALWRLMQVETDAPNVAINTPRVAGGSTGGAGLTTTPHKPGPPALAADAEKPLPSRNGGGTPPTGVKRDPDVDAVPAIKSLPEMKQIFISLNGDTSPSPALRAPALRAAALRAAALRECLIRQLEASRRWTAASREDADAALNVVIGANEHTASVQLVNANGRILWPAKGKWRTYSGDAEQIAKQVVGDLLKATR